MAGIVDEPIIPGGEDQLGIQEHSEALCRFIESTDTPITIGVQGEWGSGKTSLLNSIHHYLENKEIYKLIWINTWENSLLSSPEEAFLKIINEIISEMLTADKDENRVKKIKEITALAFRGAIRVGAAATLGSKAGQFADELFGTQDQIGLAQNSIKKLRKELDDLVNSIRNRGTNNFQKIIVFVDDLDRVEPKDAVRILELLKNIFSIKGCVFILAIDYQVIVKGLKEKFGEQTRENEWEFRAFFDKIIQLPFMMPLGQYNIGQYVNTVLRDIKFLSAQEENLKGIEEIITQSVGGNPRSLKRLINSLALIEISSDLKSKKEDSEETEITIDEIKHKTLLLTMVCIQIAYPYIYDLIVRSPDFISWDTSFALEITKGKEEEDGQFNNSFEAAQKTEDFNEPWEKALFRICYPIPRYKTRADEISRILSFIQNDILQGIKAQPGDVIGQITGKTALTNVVSTDQSDDSGKPKRKILTKIKCLSHVKEGNLVVQLEGMSDKIWNLSDKTDYQYYKKMIREMKTYALENGATIGQVAAVTKMLNSHGYRSRP